MARLGKQALGRDDLEMYEILPFFIGVGVHMYCMEYIYTVSGGLTLKCVRNVLPSQLSVMLSSCHGVSLLVSPITGSPLDHTSSFNPCSSNRPFPYLLGLSAVIDAPSPPVFVAV